MLPLQPAALAVGFTANIDVWYKSDVENFSVTLKIWRGGNSVHTAKFSVEPIDKQLSRQPLRPLAFPPAGAFSHAFHYNYIDITFSQKAISVFHKIAI